MLVLALDTSTDAVVVGLVSVSIDGGPPIVLAEQVHPGARRHGEQLAPAVLDVCAAAGRRMAEVDAMVCGVGPGPFTGLRVGIVTAAALGDALDVPVYGVCSLDATAVDATADSEAGKSVLVVTDARRREVYWAAYDRVPGARAVRGRRAVQRLAGPAVDTPTALAARGPELGVAVLAGAAAAEHAELLGLPALPARAPSPVGLVTVAGPDLLAGVGPEPLEPCYLRRPDAVPPTVRTRVRVG